MSGPTRVYHPRGPPHDQLTQPHPPVAWWLGNGPAWALQAQGPAGPLGALPLEDHQWCGPHPNVVAPQLDVVHLVVGILSVPLSFTTV